MEAMSNFGNGRKKKTLFMLENDSELLRYAFKQFSKYNAGDNLRRAPSNTRDRRLIVTRETLRSTFLLGMNNISVLLFIFKY